MRSACDIYQAMQVTEQRVDEHYAAIRHLGQLADTQRGQWIRALQADFATRHRHPAQVVYRNYVDAVEAALRPVDTGYMVWIPELMQEATNNRELIPREDIARLQPTEQEREAFLAVVGRPMEYPTTTEQ